MNKFLSMINNEKGSALIVIVMLVPVLTLMVVFALTTGQQNVVVAGNDDCHRDALYNADGAVYGTSKLISLIGKDPARNPIQAGTGQAAPGVQYLDANGDPINDADWFRHMVISEESQDTGEDVEFVTTDPANNIGLKSKVDIRKFRGGIPGGGGAEFGSAAEGIGAQMGVVVYQLRSEGRSNCLNSPLPVVGEYWLIVDKAGQTKGI